MISTLSFRDPDGAVTCFGDRVIRRVAAQRAFDLRELLQLRSVQGMISARRLINSRELALREEEDLEPRARAIFDSFGAGGLLLEHDRVWFPSYPAEWPAEMLYAAGHLTIDLAEAILEEGYGLKDATPHNVLFRGPNPVFIDILSFDRRAPADATWLPYAQFMRMFVLPLLLHREFGAKTGELLAVRTHGVEPEEVYARCSRTQRLLPRFLGSVTIPTWLAKHCSRQPAKQKANGGQVDQEKARFILAAHLRGLRRTLQKVEPRSDLGKSIWSSYSSTSSYSAAELEQKLQCVGRWLKDCNAKTVLDLGCNSGSFSAIAAELGAQVVAVDADPVVVGRLWRQASREKLDILPLVVNIASPTPRTGWRNSECPSFLDRATGRFDTVMMLALIHHLLITERIPLAELFDLAADLTTENLIIEYIDPADPLFQALLRGRDALHATFGTELFETTCQKRFTILQKQPVKGSLRTLYLLQKK